MLLPLLHSAWWKALRVLLSVVWVLLSVVRVLALRP